MFNKCIKLRLLLQRFFSFFGVFVIVVSLGTVSVFAAGSNGNKFVFKDYVKYSFTDNDTVVVADVSFPTDWIVTSVFKGSDYIDSYTGPEVSFGLTGDNIYALLNLEMRPLGGSAYTGHDVGYQFVDTNFIDLRYVPESTTVKFGFEVTVSSYKIIDYPTPKTTIMLYFVDSSGKVIYKYTDGFYAGISSIGDTRILVYDYGLELENLNLPSNVVGVVPYMLLYNMQVDFESIDIKYMPFEFVYSMSALQYESAGNQQLQDSIEDVGKALDELATGTPEQNQQAQNAVGGLNSSTDKLDALGDQMASIEKPTIDSNQISADSLVPDTSLLVLSSPFQALWENKQLLAMLTIVVTLVLVSWVFFGKKG